MADRAPPSLETVAATLGQLLTRGGARRAVALVDREGAAPAAVVDCAPGRRALVSHDPDAPGTELDLPGDVRPFHLGDVRPLGHVEVDALQGEVTSLPGAVETAARVVLRAAEWLGGRSVVTAEWETANPEAPFSIAARQGDPLVLGLGVEQFRMPAGWPGTT
jgi:hypothetical protein